MNYHVINLSLLLLLLLLVLSTSLVLSIGSDPRRALIVIDVQKCFVSGGSLAVPGGDDVVPVINEIRKKFGAKFRSVYLSVDYHPPGHVSFASQHDEKQVFETVTLRYNDQAELCRPTTLRNEVERTVECDQVSVKIDQTLWPDHCVYGTPEVNLAPNLFLDEARDQIIFKGNNPSIDFYSVFFDNGNLTSTGLHDRLRKENIRELFMVGLATDYCVKFSSLDAARLGYKVYVVKDATRAVTEDGFRKAIEEMTSIGILFIDSSELETVLGDTQELIEI